LRFSWLPPEACRDFFIWLGNVIHIPVRLTAAQAEFWFEQTLVPVCDAGVNHGYRIVTFVQALYQQAESLGYRQLGFNGFARLLAIGDPLPPGRRIQPFRNQDTQRVKLTLPPWGIRGG